MYSSYKKEILLDAKNKFLKEKEEKFPNAPKDFYCKYKSSKSFEEFKDCCTAIYYEDITNTGYFANVNNVELNNCIDILNEKAIKYLGKYFCYLVQEIYNNEKNNNREFNNNDDIKWYSLFCNIIPLDIYLIKAVISATKIVSTFLNKIIINHDLDEESILDFKLIHNYMNGYVNPYVYKENYDGIDIEKFDNEEVINKLNKRIKVESDKHYKIWNEFINNIKDKKYKEAMKNMIVIS